MDINKEEFSQRKQSATNNETRPHVAEDGGGGGGGGRVLYICGPVTPVSLVANGVELKEGFFFFLQTISDNTASLHSNQHPHIYSLFLLSLSLSLSSYIGNRFIQREFPYYRFSPGDFLR